MNKVLIARSQTSARAWAFTALGGVGSPKVRSGPSHCGAQSLTLLTPSYWATNSSALGMHMPQLSWPFSLTGAVGCGAERAGASAFGFCRQETRPALTLRAAWSPRSIGFMDDGFEDDELEEEEDFDIEEIDDLEDVEDLDDEDEPGYEGDFDEFDEEEDDDDDDL